jgi:hypothetical protein
MTNDLLPRFLRSDAAARRVGLSPGTLARLRSHGGGPVYRIVGGVCLYAPEDLDAWVLDRPTITSTAVQKASAGVGGRRAMPRPAAA